MANSNDLGFSLIKEVTMGTTPVTAVVTPFPWADGTSIQLKNDSVVSPVIMPNRASAGQVNTSYWVEGTLKTQLMRHAAIDACFESLFSNTFSTTTLKSGSTDNSLTIEKMFKEGGSPFYRQFKGSQFGKAEISTTATGIVDLSMDFTGMMDNRGTAIMTGATYTPATNPKKLGGLDTAVVISGITAPIAKVSVSIEMGRKAQFGINSNGNPFGIAANGARKISTSITYFRQSWSPETALMTGSPVPMLITWGGANTGYSLKMSQMTFDAPQDEEDDQGLFATVTGTAGYDPTDASDAVFTRL